MDTVTYPDKMVKDELESWVFERFDASKHRQAARELGIRAVPVAVALVEGRILGRMENFVEAAAFRDWLRDVRSEENR
jgi:thioredoxin-like negative regulator of GroEL